VLPIGSATHSIAVIGDGAGSNAMSGGGGSASVSAPYVVTPYQGIKARAGSGATVTYSQGNLPSNGALPPVPSSALTPPSGGGNGLFAEYHNSTDLSGAVAASRVEPAVDDNWGGNSPLAGVNATNWSVKYTGTLHPTVTGSHQFSVTSDDGSRLFVNGQQVIDNWHDQPSTTRTGSINLTAGQNVSIEVDYYQAAGASNLTLGWAVPGQTAGDQAVAAARAADLALVVVNKFESEGGDLNDIDLASDQNTLVSNVAAANPNTVVVVNSGSAVTMPWAGAVKGIIESWYPGQEYGNALAALLFGDANFSGRLPVSFPQSLSNVPAHTTAQWPGQNGQVQYSEGLNVGYRWYDSQNITPLFPFGFGLSYTSFSYAHLTVGAPDASGNVAVSFDVTNSGSRAGAEVPQVYVGQPAAIGEPPKNLRGFTRVSLNPGQTQNVSLTLDARSFQFWNDGWANGGGTHQIYVGSSSRNIQLTGDVTIVGTRPPIPRTPLPRTGWSASASATFGGDVPANMLDGDAGTRWSTGTPMASDQWVTVDMGSTHPVDQITMDSAGSASDYARGYQVFLSSDGTSWGSAVATGAGSGALVTATFAAQTARYIKVVQTGSNSSWWSIAEFNAYASPTSPNLLPRTGWSASASATFGGDVPANMLDGDAGTRWSTGTPMANGQWVTVDMGATHPVDQITMDSAGSASDYAHGYQVFLSSDGVSWGSAVATGTGSGPLVTVTFPAQSARYIKVVQTGSSSSWWSIAEFNAYT
jgi:beta-glucosidase